MAGDESHAAVVETKTSGRGLDEEGSSSALPMLGSPTNKADTSASQPHKLVLQPVKAGSNPSLATQQHQQQHESSVAAMLAAAETRRRALGGSLDTSPDVGDENAGARRVSTPTRHQNHATTHMRNSSTLSSSSKGSVTSLGSLSSQKEPESLPTTATGFTSSAASSVASTPAASPAASNAEEAAAKKKRKEMRKKRKAQVKALLKSTLEEIHAALSTEKGRQILELAAKVQMASTAKARLKEAGGDVSKSGHMSAKLKRKDPASSLGLTFHTPGRIQSRSIGWEMNQYLIITDVTEREGVKHGLQPRDVVLAVDDSEVHTIKDLQAAVAGKKKCKFKIIRDSPGATPEETESLRQEATAAVRASIESEVKSKVKSQLKALGGASDRSLS